MSTALKTPAPAASAAMRSFAAQWQARPRDPLFPARERALQRFLALGLPTTHDETWRHTNLRSLAAQSFVDAPRKSRGEIEGLAAPALLDRTAASLLVVNGYPVLPADDLAGVQIRSLREMAQAEPQALSRLLEPGSDTDLKRWSLLNAALYVDGLYLKITAPVAEPLMILHLATADGDGSIAYPRIIIEAAPGTAATVIEQWVAPGGHTPVNNSDTHIALGRDAQLDHYRVFATDLGATHLDSLTIRQHGGSRCRQFTVALGGGLVRAGLEAHLDEPGAALDSYSLLVGCDERHIDCVNVVTHGAPETRSTQTARAIAGGSSRVIFNSKVIVDAGAVHAQSQQSCRGLLMSPTAEIDTRPQLEIHADEVKCAHGATTGRLDPDMLFYMLSRGLDRETAQSLLVFAFLSDVLTGMAVPSARTAIENALITQLPDPQTLRKFR